MKYLYEISDLTIANYELNSSFKGIRLYRNIKLMLNVPTEIN